MRSLALLGLIVASTCSAQEVGPAHQKPMAPQDEEQAAPSSAPTEAQSQMVTIPAGTQVPLTLANHIRSRTAHPGDAVRAVTALPVTVGSQVVIPPGSYVEGVIDKVIRGGFSKRARLQMHFTRIFFPNGYSLPLEGATAEANRRMPSEDSPAAAETHAGRIQVLAVNFRQNPTPPPLPKLGPSAGELAGIGVGVAAAFTITAILIAHNRGVDTFFEPGFAFVMEFQAPLELDLDRVAAAPAGSQGTGS